MEVRGKKGVEMPLKELDNGDIFWRVDDYYLKIDFKEGIYIKTARLSDGSITTFHPDTTVEYISGFFRLIKEANMEIKKYEETTISLNDLYAGDVFSYVDECYIKTNAKADGYVKAVRLCDGEIGLFEGDTKVEYVDGHFQLD